MSGVSSQPRIAFLVACHNDGETLDETVESLRAEPDSELVVVDDGSTEAATRETLAALERRGTPVLYQENKGPAAAWMNGLSATEAPYVMPFSSDDLLVQGAARRLADALDASPGAAMAWGDLRSFGAASSLIPSAPLLCPWLVTYVNTLPGIALFRRSLLIEAGGWQLRTGIEDWDLWMRLAARGSVGVHVPGVSFLYRRSAGGRFRGRVKSFEPFYEELRERNQALFDARSVNRQRSQVPSVLKAVIPLVDRLPFASRLLKIQICDALSLFLWRAGLRRTLHVVFHGLLFRARMFRPAEPEARAQR